MARKSKAQVTKSDGSVTSIKDDGRTEPSNIDSADGNVSETTKNTYAGILYGQEHPVTPVPFPLPTPLVEEITEQSQDQEEEPDDKFWREIGVYGFGVYAGFVRAAYTSELFWPDCIRIYNRIRRGDPETNIVRQVWSSFAQNVTGKWNAPDKPTDKEKQAVDFIQSVWDEMLGGENKLINTTINFVPFMGWGYWEFLPALRKKGWRAPNPIETWESKYDDGLIGLREIAWRDPSTFWRWELDNWTQRLLGMWQAAYLSGLPPVFIPISSALHLRFGDLDNPEGFALCEPMYRMERLKYGLEVVYGIGAEHSAGYLNVSLKKGKITSEDKKIINQASRAIMTAKEGNFAAWPENIEAEIKDVPFSSAPAILEAIKYYSILKLTLFGMQYVAQSGMSGRGSYAAVESSSGMATEMFNSLLEGMAHQIDDQVGHKIFDVWNGAYFNTGVPKSIFTSGPQGSVRTEQAFRRPHYELPPLDRMIQLNELGQFLDSIWGNLPLTESDFKNIRKQSMFLDPNIPADEDVIVGGQNTKTAATSKPLEERAGTTKQKTQLPLRNIANSMPPMTPRESAQANRLMQQMRERVVLAERSGE